MVRAPLCHNRKLFTVEVTFETRREVQLCPMSPVPPPGKFNQGVSAEAKKQTWAEITNQINSLGENHREVGYHLNTPPNIWPYLTLCTINNCIVIFTDVQKKEITCEYCDLCSMTLLM